MEKVKRDGTGLIMLWPKFLANLCPLGWPPVERIIFFAIIEIFSLLKIVKRLSEVFKISLTKNLVDISTPLFIAFFFKQLITS